MKCCTAPNQFTKHMHIYMHVCIACIACWQSCAHERITDTQPRLRTHAHVFASPQITSHHVAPHYVPLLARCAFARNIGIIQTYGAYITFVACTNACTVASMNGHAHAHAYTCINVIVVAHATNSYTYTYTYTYIYMHIHIHEYLYIYIYIYIYLCIYINTNLHQFHKCTNP